MKRTEIKDKTFEDLGISPGLLSRIKALGFEHPTPIQAKAIPVGIEGKDIVGVAQTGSGKTLAFSIPMLENIANTNKPGLVLLPTRELAVQVEETLHKITRGGNFRTALVIGGANAHPQIKKLKAKPHVIVATPGRLLDHMSQRYVSLSDIGTLVLDEADRMLDMGFAPQLNRILLEVPKKRHTMLFSATMPEEIIKIVHKYMNEPVRIEASKSGTTVDKICQEMVIVPKEKKMELLEQLLTQHKGSVLVFSRTKHGAKKMAYGLRQKGLAADEIHSNRTQAQRQKALKGFSSGKMRILVATDIAARGIDVKDIELVVNFDLPEHLDDYVHRIGRTGRAGKSGKAISFVLPSQRRDIQKIERMIKLTIPVKKFGSEGQVEDEREVTQPRPFKRRQSRPRSQQRSMHKGNGRRRNKNRKFSR